MRSIVALEHNTVTVNVIGYGFDLKIKSNQLHVQNINSRVGRKNLVLRHSVRHFLPSSEGIAC